MSRKQVMPVFPYWWGSMRTKGRVTFFTRTGRYILYMYRDTIATKCRKKRKRNKFGGAEQPGLLLPVVNMHLVRLSPV
jgi:hypothetical protein